MAEIVDSISLWRTFWLGLVLYKINIKRKIFIKNRTKSMMGRLIKNKSTELSLSKTIHKPPDQREREECTHFLPTMSHDWVLFSCFTNHQLTNPSPTNLYAFGNSSYVFFFYFTTYNTIITSTTTVEPKTSKEKGNPKQPIFWCLMKQWNKSKFLA